MYGQKHHFSPTTHEHNFPLKKHCPCLGESDTRSQISHREHILLRLPSPTKEGPEAATARFSAALRGIRPPVLTQPILKPAPGAHLVTTGNKMRGRRGKAGGRAAIRHGGAFTRCSITEGRADRRDRDDYGYDYDGEGRLRPLARSPCRPKTEPSKVSNRGLVFLPSPPVDGPRSAFAQIHRRPFF